MEGGAGQNQYGRGQGGTGTGVGHHKGHHEGHLHGHGPGEAEKANCELCTRDQAAGKFHSYMFEILNLSFVRSYSTRPRHRYVFFSRCLFFY